MKHEKTRSFLAGMLTALLLCALATPALADAAEKMIKVSSDVKIYMNDVRLATDAYGNPVDAFIYNGTTYLPIRAVSEALGVGVQWDGATRSVYLGKHGNSGESLLEVCPPYETSGFHSEDIITMAGNKYTGGLETASYGNNYAYFNLNGKYNTLTFDVGHVDGSGMYKTTLNIYLDGNLAASIDLTGDMLPKTYSIPLNGALQMKFEVPSVGSYPRYAIVNSKLF